MKSTIEELTAFVSIVDSGSSSKLRSNWIKPHRVSAEALQRLELKLNVTLLERTTRKLKLTYEGQQFLAKARKILLDLTEAEESLAK